MNIIKFKNRREMSSRKGFDQGWEFVLSLIRYFALSLKIANLKSNCKQFTHVAVYKRVTVSNLLMSVFTKEPPWAIPSLKKSNMSDSLVIWANSSWAQIIMRVAWILRVEWILYKWSNKSRPRLAVSKKKKKKKNKSSPLNQQNYVFRILLQTWLFE